MLSSHNPPPSFKRLASPLPDPALSGPASRREGGTRWGFTYLDVYSGEWDHFWADKIRDCSFLGGLACRGSGRGVALLASLPTQLSSCQFVVFAYSQERRTVVEVGENELGLR